jgi:hypothetical protein
MDHRNVSEANTCTIINRPKLLSRGPVVVIAVEEKRVGDWYEGERLGAATRAQPKNREL